MRLKLILVFPLLVAFGSCRQGDFSIPQAWLSVPEAARMRSLVLDEQGNVSPQAQATPRPLSDGPIHLSGGRLMNGEKALTDAFLAVDSFDYSEARGEVVFSAKRDGGFDIGLVSSDGSPINWAPADPADELDVQWAPRGHKVSYVLRASGGDIVRTLHIPTSATLQVPFENATIHALAWDPAAERYAVGYSTSDASDRVEVLKYSGAERRMALPPAVRLDVEVEPFAPGAILLRPRDLRYGERLPAVVWRASDFGWSDARAALMQDARVAVVVTTRMPSPELWSRVEATPWIDAKRAFVVGADGGRESAIEIGGEQSVPAGRYRRSGNVVTVPPAVVQSFAAGFIAEQLKRTSPTNGSSR
ncbi:MAG TPA: hypothetical protein VE974_16030 [Thermoanaerobaculia bacterium]|nr:hypothetical protein [Thermoanaerobaculia bacterium]